MFSVFVIVQTETLQKIIIVIFTSSPPHHTLITLVVGMMMDDSLVGWCQYIPHPQDAHWMHWMHIGCICGHRIMGIPQD